MIAGLTAYASRGNIARAALESTAYQVYDLGEAMAADLGAALPGELRVDGGMIRNELLMQFQADILGRPVVAAPITEITALGAAYAAGLAVGFWSGLDELRSMDRAGRRWEPSMDEATRAAGIARWHKGVERTLGWVEPGPGLAGPVTAPPPRSLREAPRWQRRRRSRRRGPSRGPRSAC